LSQSHFQSGVAYKQDPVDGSARKLKILYLIFDNAKNRPQANIYS